MDADSQEKTIRPLPRKRSDKLPDPTKQPSPRKSSPRKHGRKPSQAKSSGKPQLGNSRFELPSRPDLMYREQSVEDYSDLFFDNDNVFNQRVDPFAKKVCSPLVDPSSIPRVRVIHTNNQGDAPQLFHPSDLTSLPRSSEPPVGGSMRRKVPSRPSVLPDRPMRRTRSSIEIQKFAENEGDEDFSDIFGLEDQLTEKDESDRGSEDGGLMLLSKLSNNSWLGDDEDEDDPFAFMDPGWDEMDLEANIARDRHARLAEKVEELVRSLKTTEGEEKLLVLSEDLIILEDVEIQENLCFVGGIPIITKFAARQYSNEIRVEAAAFVRQMYQTSTLTLQMFVSAGGLNVLVEFLDEDYDDAKDLVLIGVNGIWNVFELQGPTPKNDFCRIFSRSKILYPLALVLHRVLDEEGEDELSELVEGRIVNIFYLFSQAENYVKEVVADRQVLKSVLKDLRRMTPIHQITMLKFIKNLSMLTTTLESLHSADAIEFLIDLLSYTMKRGQEHFRETSNQVLNTMFNLCRLNKERQVDAAVGGIIPLLMRIMQTDRPPKEFALPILCDMAHSGSKGRRYLWQNKGLDFYVSLLADQYWQVTALDAIFVWLQEETAKVESHLLDGKFTNAIVACFDTNKINTFDSNLLEPLLKLLRLSPAICGSLAMPEMFAGIGQRLGHKKAVVRLNLLRLVRNIMDTCEMDAMGTGNGSSSLNSRQVQSLVGAIQTLADKDSAVLVRNLASELVRSHVEGDTYEGMPPERKGSAGSIASRRSGSGLRRTSSYTPPGLHSAVSMPPTPTSSSHSRHRTAHHPSLSGNAYIEVAASPRRTPVTGTQERESILYRPRSRDGATAIPRRVSGDMSSGTPTGSGSKSRLPRTSTSFTRPNSLSAQSPVERLGGVSACFDTGTRVQQLSWQETQQGSQL
ncbi:hypothetical protein ACHAQF_002262 [Verticillium nonalfalfae]